MRDFYVIYKYIWKYYKCIYLFSFIYLLCNYLIYTFQNFNKIWIIILLITFIINISYIWKKSINKQFFLLNIFSMIMCTITIMPFIIFLILLVIFLLYNNSYFLTTSILFLLYLIIYSFTLYIFIIFTRITYYCNYYNILKDEEEILVLLNNLKEYNKNKYKYTGDKKNLIYLLSELLKEIDKIPNENYKLKKLISNGKLNKKLYYNFKISEIYVIALFELIDNANKIEDVLYIIQNNKLTLKDIYKLLQKINNRNDFEIEQVVDKMFCDKRETISFLVKMEKYLSIYSKLEKIRIYIYSAVIITIVFLMIMFVCSIEIYSRYIVSIFNYIANYINNNLLNTLLSILIPGIVAVIANIFQRFILYSTIINTNVEFIIAILKDKIENFNNSSYESNKLKKKIYI